ncbi:DUF4235 domain-containing protein [Streptomyces sp. NPDC059506]|uniref:DUF4235 domain-containing protein n=1 Tax=Streptomyces TaxID=1883 RepID=UPI000CC829C1|nr:MULTISPECIES: DUF4235 domain-containing protein [unclassified Streptomyces]MCZ2527149.1 DUF4235 domain-containing protein [Streptomyces sp. HB2AG]PLW66246.1 hypothetical protein C0036_23805 [Streptomyces sp. DJ]QMV24429.1 DUF4235 domain-containing protein [Streptomyces sp. SCUT-3]
MAKVYEPVGFLVGTLGGLAAGQLFKRAWRSAGRRSYFPEPTAERARWPEVVAAAALQGAVFSAVRAVINRGGAAGLRRATGNWPGHR